MPAYSLQPTPQELSHLEELRTKIKLYQGTRSARCRMDAELVKLEQRRNLPLPHELTGMIFDFYVHLYGQIPEGLLLVCRAWHVLAISQPALWTNLDPLGPFGLRTVRPWAGTFLQSRISRSNPVPLKVDFSQWSPCIQWKDVKKIAGIHTFRSRIQELVISSTHELHYLIGSQPLLKLLNIGPRVNPLGQLSNKPARYMLSEKMITTLRVRSQQEMHIWPESLLRRLQTLEVTLPYLGGADHECWSMVQKSVALLTLHVNVYFMNAPLLSHASCRSLTMTFCDYLSSVEEVRMPRLQELTIVTCCSDALMRLTLVDTPVFSLRLLHLGDPFADIRQAEHASWVGGAIRLLHSTPRLKRLQISAPIELVIRLSGAIAEDFKLCMELDTFIVDRPMRMEQMDKGYVEKVEDTFEKLTTVTTTLVNRRQLSKESA